jgi:hypothetical protein
VIALPATIAFYDRTRQHQTERDSRLMAEWYLRRKVPGIDANTAAELLADALARRATQKETASC